MMVAGLKIDVQCSAFRYTPVNRIKRLNLRMQAAEIAVIPFRDYAIAKTPMRTGLARSREPWSSFGIDRGSDSDCFDRRLR